MTRIALIAVLGAAGALARLGVSNVLPADRFPVATVVVNVTGAFALGLVVTWGAARLSHDVRSGLAVGFLGAYTTFSTFTMDAKRLADDGRVQAASSYVVASVTLGLIAVIAGVLLGRTLAR
jgi:CrcB protein